MTFRWFLFALIVGTVCSITLGDECKNVPTERRDIERGPRPNIELSEVQLSLRSGWLDTIDYYFKETIEKGKDALIQLGRTGVKVLDNIVKIIPTPEAVFQAAKDVFLALPQEVVVYAVDAYCK